MSFVSVVKRCYCCSGNVPWFREHAVNCPRDKPYHGPSKAIRSARLDYSKLIDNKTNLIVNRQARTQQASSKMSSSDSDLMDIDNDGYPINYDYKKLTKQNEVLYFLGHTPKKKKKVSLTPKNLFRHSLTSL